jgi:hypothetical protein
MLLLLAIPGHPCAIFAQSTWDRFRMVENIGEVGPGPALARWALVHRPPPDAVLAVVWGTGHPNERISKTCQAILDGWELRRRDRHWREFVKCADGDYDRFLSSVLKPSKAKRDWSEFELASEIGRAFARCAAEQNVDFRPCQDFSTYFRLKQPEINQGLPRFDERAPVIARVSKWNAKTTVDGIILADGNIDVEECASSIIVAGGNVRLGKVVGSVILAAGDVTVSDTNGLEISLVVSGGKVTMLGCRGKSMIVTPEPMDLAKSPFVREFCAVYDAKRKPAPGFFHFRDLWDDYGLQATLSQDRVKITKVSAESNFKELVRPEDVLLSHAKVKVESVGQFRRLLRLALDTGRIDFEIERAGKTIHVRGDLKKQPSP